VCRSRQTLGAMSIDGPVSGASHDVERILRSLPGWFGIESSLLEYVNDADVFPTFVATVGSQVAAFVTVREHFPQAWEVHCIAVHAESRNRGLGRALLRHVELWLARRGVLFLQVKTMAAASPSPEYAQTRAFYKAVGYVPLEEFPLLWGPELPVLQLVKAVKNGA